MGPDLEDLMRAAFGHSVGAWYWVANSQSVHPAKKIRWDPDPGTHPFVLIAEFTGATPASVRGRSTTIKSIFEHSRHPRQHEDTCKITEPGWIRVEWSLGPEVICRDNYSCVEPDDDIKIRLGSGEGP